MYKVAGYLGVGACCGYYNYLNKSSVVDKKITRKKEKSYRNILKLNDLTESETCDIAALKDKCKKLPKSETVGLHMLIEWYDEQLHENRQKLAEESVTMIVTWPYDIIKKIKR